MKKSEWASIKQKMLTYHLTTAWMIDRFKSCQIPIKEYQIGYFLRGQMTQSADYDVFVKAANLFMTSYETWLKEEDNKKYSTLLDMDS